MAKKTKKAKEQIEKNRAYDNSGRSQRSNFNRQKIIELYVDLLVEANGQDVPLQILAVKSGISMRTLFRFFGDKESLNAEIETYITQFSASVSESLAEMSFADYAEFSYKIFDKYERLFKAYLFTDFGQKSRIVFKKKFNELLTNKLMAELKIKPNKKQLLRIYFIANLINVHLWKDIKSTDNISGSEIAETVKWAVANLVQKINL